MTPAPHIIPTVKALLADYPEAHVARVVDAIRKGPRISLMELARSMKVSRVTVWRRIKAGQIPRPRKDGRRLNTFDYMEVKHLI